MKPRNGTRRDEACLALEQRAAQRCTIGLVRKLLKWIIVTVGITALVRWFKRRGTAPEVGAPPEDDPAEELRQKLAESREVEDPVETPAASEATVEERRADVHEQGRSALDEMKPPDEG